MKMQKQSFIAPLAVSVMIFGAASYSCRSSVAQTGVVGIPLAANSNVTRPAVAPDHLVAHYTFDEENSADVQDTGGKGGPGKRMGEASRGTGPSGKGALLLPGKAGSFVEIPKPVIDTTRSFTVAACVKLNQLSGFQTVASIDGNTASVFFLQLRDDTGSFAFTMFPGNESGGGNPTIATTDDAPDADRWYHLTGVYDAVKQNISFYLNGVLQQTTRFRGSVPTMGPTAIGRGKFGGNPVDFVNGSIDDVRFYDDALSAADVLAISDADLPVSVRQSVKPVEPATLRIDASGPSVNVSPLLYGLMTEEINFSYEGGLYAELIRNRVFKDDANQPAHWSPVQEGGAESVIALDKSQPVSGTALTGSLRWEIAKPGKRAGVANGGFWGVPVRPNIKYKASFYAKSSTDSYGPLSVTLESLDGSTVHASGTIPKITQGWQKYDLTLTTGKQSASLKNRFVIAGKNVGTVWLTQVSLFPPTYKNRPNGLRPDLMEKMASMKHSFLRLPGGNYLEGNTIAERFDWKATLGNINQRPGHPAPWGYRSSDGMGLLEFLIWCEDLNVEPVLGVFAGYALRGEYIAAGPKLQPYVQDALDEIEYITGDVNTKWGAVRAKNGHPKPFPLKYVEIGNEDWFDKSGSYDGRFAQFHDAIKAKYPQLQTIATMAVSSRKPDVLDEHYYRTARAFERDSNRYDKYDRKGPKIFVGEWATTEGRPTPNLKAALGDAAWMTGMERNSDVVIMEAYAPLLVNVNPGASQWPTNLIGYDALNSFGSPSFYVQQMFGQNHGDRTVAASLTGGSRLYQSTTRNSKTGEVYLKLVNASGTKQSVHITLAGVPRVSPNGTAIVLSGSAPTDTNSLTDPVRLIPTTSKITRLGKEFDYPLPPYSVTVLKIQTK
ncbi:MAG: alpha-L-arabinofuranosidase [Fibrella sp.]|nr:alpha-L-arabinofuranosidase [Armatimonadota bacterium]